MEVQYRAFYKISLETYSCCKQGNYLPPSKYIDKEKEKKGETEQVFSPLTRHVSI